MANGMIRNALAEAMGNNNSAFVKTTDGDWNKTIADAQGKKKSGATNKK